ncbi:Copper resistance protein B [hydrothermal vent metagenome]|uniref:Copper resistance protein B n=1 Tax=hydrothermal vent metagenome TaxID=652676 RepID=A0A1W1CZH6_9ZZZZ
MKKILLVVISMMGMMQTVEADMGGDDPLVSMFVMDKLEVLNNEEKSKRWEASLWIGYDINRISLYSTGEIGNDGLESSQNELVFSRAIAPFWNAEIGLAYDKNADNSQTWAEVALSGLAPYYFEVRTALLVNAEGNIGLRVDAEYELLFTQKLILTPSLEADFYTKDAQVLGIGSGLSSVEAGLRLRYEFVREFAPYIGVTWEKTFGNTADYNPIDETSVLMGVRFWF